MTTKNTKHTARARVLKARHAANAERAAREAAIVDTMADLMGELDALATLDSRTETKIAEIETKTHERITALQQEMARRSERVREQAQAKATAHEKAAGAALRQLRAQHESVASIAAQTEQSPARLRALLKTQDAETADAAREPGDTALTAVPSEGAAPAASHTPTVDREQPAAVELSA